MAAGQPSVRIATRLRAGRHGSIPGYDIYTYSLFVHLSQCPDRPPIQWVPGPLSQAVKRAGSAADHSPESSAEVKNERSYSLPPIPIRLNVVVIVIHCRGNFKSQIIETNVFQETERKQNVTAENTLLKLLVVVVGDRCTIFLLYYLP